MVFRDDERESNPTSFKFLQMAHAWKAKGKKVLPILGGAGGKADQEGDREKEKSEGTSATKERAGGKGKVRDNGDDEASDVASSHGGDDQDGDGDDDDDDD